MTALQWGAQRKRRKIFPPQCWRDTRGNGKEVEVPVQAQDSITVPLALLQKRSAPIIFSVTELGDSLQRCEQRDLERFYSWLEEGQPSRSCPELGPCYLWTGSTVPNGYGQFWFNRRNWLAHRFSFLVHGGALTPERPRTLHHCDVRLCCRFEHLFAGSDVDNTADMLAKNRQRSNAPKGEKCGAHRLTEAQVREIKSRSESSLYLAPIYGVHSSTIRYLRAGRSWKEVE
jgi:hypothetical protein